jgi:hypothetical protein
MEITRLQPFPLAFSQGGFDPDTDYVLTILDDHATDLLEIALTSDGDGVISTNLPNYFSRYDDEYRGEVYIKQGTNEDGSSIFGDLVWIDTITIMRPYVDPTLIAETADDIADAKMYEAIARAIINSITGGFMYKRETVETVGLGNDYLAAPFRLNKIVRVYENDVLVYDSEPLDPATWTNTYNYYITPDKGAISVAIPGSTGYNRLQSRAPYRIKGASDSFTLYNTNDSPNYSEATSYDTKMFTDGAGGSPMFPSNWDYTVIVEAGWPVIPQDIKQAAQLIINDLKCNNIPYINSYIKDYKSDQFDLTFDDRVFKDTGNRIADKILSAYVRPIYRLGVI